MEFEQQKINDRVLRVAKKYEGVREFGNGDNPIIVKWFNDAGSSWIKNDEAAWCSAFACGVAVEAGVHNPKTVRAHNWTKISPDHGEHINNVRLLQPGDFFVVTRGRGLFHVSIVDHVDKRVFGLGGNQRNMVCVAPYTFDRFVVGIRMHEVSIPARV